MRIEFYEVPPPGYVTVEHAGGVVNRSPRTIYDWIKIEGLRTFKRSNAPVLVNLSDVQRVDTIRRGPRRRGARVKTR